MMSYILLIEAFYTGSHAQLIDTLVEGLGWCSKYTLPGKKWHWRARTSALHFSQTIPPSNEYRILFTSSVLNLAELIALRPDLCKLKKIVYFHENQLVYPVRKHQDRDFQYGYNQIITCLAADVVVFNSKYNMESFLSSIGTFLKLMPDFRPKCLAEKIRLKCEVLYFPIDLPKLHLENVLQLHQENIHHLGNIPQVQPENNSVADWNNKRNSTEDKILDLTAQKDHQVVDAGELRSEVGNLVSGVSEMKLQTIQSDLIPADTAPLKIIWAHRWEHDKNPEMFFSAMYKLQESGQSFKISVLGENFSEIPDIFKEANERLKCHIHHWGYQQSKEDYYKVLIEGDVAVSTANHEFFGVAMLEAVHCGCFPLCPNKLVYPEIFPKDCLYNTEQQLFKQLRKFCRNPTLVRSYNRTNLSEITNKYSWSSLKEDYLKLFAVT